MTVRLTIQFSSDDTEVTEFEDFARVMDYLVGPLQFPGRPTLMVMQELDAPTESTWGQVMVGDEVVAPDGTCWMVERDLRDANGVVAFHSNILLTRGVPSGQRKLEFVVTANMPVMRRSGMLSAAAQLLHDVGLWSGQ